MPFKRTRPYNALPPLPPAKDLETKAILKATVGAHRSLAELKGVSGLIPNPALMVNSIPLQEAKASSEIENIVTTQDNLFKAELNEKGADPATKEVLRYRTALWAGFEAVKSKPLGINAFKRICSTIKNMDMQVRKIAGTAVKNMGTGEVLYTPPEGERIILGHLSALERFIHNEADMDLLVKMALIHYQFEAIHPFSDGNGRTGRIINILYLVEKGLLDNPVLYLSRYIVRNKSKYYSLISGITEKGEWEPWVLYMLNAVQETSLWTTQKIREIKNSFDKARTLCQCKLPKPVYSTELVEAIFRQPYCRIDVLVKDGIAKRETASKYLQMLVKIGLLKSKKIGRDKLYLNPALIKILSN